MTERQHPSEKRRAEIDRKVKELKARYVASFGRTLDDKELLSIVREIETDNKKDIVRAALKPLTESDFNYFYDVVLLEAIGVEKLVKVAAKYEQQQEVKDGAKVSNKKKLSTEYASGGGTGTPG